LDQFMGYTTDFIGHIQVSPPLNDSEQQYLMAFGRSRRFDRPNGPYEVPGNPAAEYCDRPLDTDVYNTVAPGQPSLWCGWTPCWEGCCISFDGHEKFYAATSWMGYLIEHFLAPGAHAASSRQPAFEEFTFDHVLNGVIAACRRDTRELYLIRVERNVVREETIVAPVPEYFDMPDLPYEAEIDGSRESCG
jgi:hypothetical protein